MVPLFVAWKPNCVVAPAPRLPFQPALVAVTAAPDWPTVALQLLVIFWLPPKVQVTRQPPIVDVPLFRTVTLAVKPVPQSFWIAYAAEQLRAPVVVLGEGVGLVLVDGEGVGLVLVDGVGVGLPPLSLPIGG